MPRLTLTLASAALVSLSLAGCSSSSGSGAAVGTPSSSVPAAATSGPPSVVSSTAPSAPSVSPSAAGSSPAASGGASTASASSAGAPAGGAHGPGITFTGKISGRMSATACSGGMAQLEVDVDGQTTSFAGEIDAKDFAFVGPNSSAFSLAKGTSAPQVSAGGTTFTVHHTRLIGIVSDDTVTADGSVTCP